MAPLQGSGLYHPPCMTGSSPRHRERNLSFAAGAMAAGLFAALDLYKWIEAATSDHFHNDFTFYLAAARIGLSHGWPSIYDLSLQQAELDAIGSGIKMGLLARYISRPPGGSVAEPAAGACT